MREPGSTSRTASIPAIAELAGLEERGVGLVVATRPHEAGTDAELLATVTSDPAAEVLRLPPLTRAAVAELVESRLTGIPDQDPRGRV